MKTYNISFYVSEKLRTHRFASSLAAGAKVHGDVVELVPKETYGGPVQGFDGAANLGLSRAAKRLRDDYQSAGKHFIFFDKGYIKAKHWRVSVDEWQPLAYFQRFARAPDRFRESGFQLEDRKLIPEDNAPIVFAGACQNYTNYCNLGNVNEYNLSVLQKLRAHSDRPIAYRPNPSWYTKHYEEFIPIHKQVENVTLSEPSTPFVEELTKCHLLVTHGSGASVAAIAHGIPAMVLGGGIARSVALTECDFDKINEPPYFKEAAIRQFFYDLAYCQWTDEEYCNGKAWGEIRAALNYLEKNPDPDIIGQYRLMHASLRYFRGFSTLKYRDEIDALVKSTRTETMLDYGSGKGEQYGNPVFGLKEQWGVLEVRCYDPGVDRLSKLPRGEFDGVICCDVMEHVPEAQVDTVLKEIFSKARRFVFFAIATVPATKNLPDGRNCHLTVRPIKWWEDKINAAIPEVAKFRGLITKVIGVGKDDD